MPDPSHEWTSSLCKFVKDHFNKIQESLSPSSASITNPLHMNAPQPVGTEDLLKQWNYYVELCRTLYEEQLLERMDYLVWVLEIFEKIKSIEDPGFTLILTMLLQYIDEFVQNEELSRRLALCCCKKIHQIVFDFNVELHSQDLQEKEKEKEKDKGQDKDAKDKDKDVKEEIKKEKDEKPKSPEKQPGSNQSTPTKSASGNGLSEVNNNMIMQNGSVNPVALELCFKEIIECSKFRNILYNLCTMVQCIVLDCPTALVWLRPLPGDSHEGRHIPSPTNGSPLDYLPCEPSALPIVPSPKSEQLRKNLKDAEDAIRNRSQMAEKKWSFHAVDQKGDRKAVGTMLNRQMNILEFLDKYLNHFDVRPVSEGLKTSNPFDIIYKRVFSHDQNSGDSEEGEDGKKGKSPTKPPTSLLLEEAVAEDIITVRLLCEWAVTTKRLGEYRAKLVAKLLEKRQIELTERQEEQLEAKKKDEVITVEVKSESSDKDAEKVITSSTTTSTSSGTSGPAGESAPSQPPSQPQDHSPIYQNILFDYLDNYAPVYDDKNQTMFSGTSGAFTTPEHKQAFHNLILLFSELIRCEVFSHDKYMCTLISRGLFVNPPSLSLLQSNSSSGKSSNESDGFMETSSKFLISLLFFNLLIFCLLSILISEPSSDFSTQKQLFIISTTLRSDVKQRK